MQLPLLVLLLGSGSAAERLQPPQQLLTFPGRALQQASSACATGGGNSCEADAEYFAEESGWFDVLDRAYARFQECIVYRTDDGCRGGAHPRRHYASARMASLARVRVRDVRFAARVRRAALRSAGRGFPST